MRIMEVMKILRNDEHMQDSSKRHTSVIVIDRVTMSESSG